MRDTAVIAETGTDRPATLARRIDARGARSAMTTRADRVPEAFEAPDGIGSLAILDHCGGAAGAGARMEMAATQTGSPHTEDAR